MAVVFILLAAKLMPIGFYYKNKNALNVDQFPLLANTSATEANTNSIKKLSEKAGGQGVKALYIRIIKIPSDEITVNP
jgi:hypothetical protein